VHEQQVKKCTKSITILKPQTMVCVRIADTFETVASFSVSGARNVFVYHCAYCELVTWSGEIIC
jgi:aspartate carbamoyltransferase regulatory subunit